jgi:hypothetical protein
MSDEHVKALRLAEAAIVNILYMRPMRKDKLMKSVVLPWGVKGSDIEAVIYLLLEEGRINLDSEYRLKLRE